jgi:menaquinone-9 beta-reductase
VRTDALVVGGGPAGAALAIRLATAGRAVTLLERSAAPVDKVCGEFLSGEAASEIASLGLDLSALGAVEIHTLRLCLRDQVAAIPLPFRAISLSRRVLDEALLARAAAVGATVLRGAKVNELSPAGATWRAAIADGSEVVGASAFLATGKHDLRDHKRPRGDQDDLVAFKLHWDLGSDPLAALAGHVELVPFEAGYAGLSLVERGRANLCLVIRRRRLLALGRRWDRILAAIRSESPHLDARLADAQPRWSRPLALSAIPYGYVRRHANALWRLGDQAAVIPSYCGEGVSIALHSAALAASIYLRGGGADEYQEQLARDVRRQVQLATRLSRALVRRPGQWALSMATRIWPGLIGALATRTRVRAVITRPGP